MTCLKLVVPPLGNTDFMLVIVPVVCYPSTFIWSSDSDRENGCVIKAKMFYQGVN